MLKSAYRKLAMQYHPDRNPGDDSAEALFKEVNEAYDVLKDGQKRAAYDRFGHAAFENGGGGGGGFGAHSHDFASTMSDIFEEFFGMSGGGRRSGGRERGADLRYNLEITLEEAFAGKTVEIEVPTSITCQPCGGSGAKRSRLELVAERDAAAAKLATVTTQIVCETLDISPDLVIAERPDTARTPDAGTPTASRQTLLTGESTRRAACKLKTELDAGKTIADLEGKEFYGEYLTETDRMGSPKPNPVSHVAYGYAAQVVMLDETGKVERVVAAYDVGRVVNPKSACGQIEGGVVMGLGYAFTEDYPLKDSVPLAKYGTLGLWRADQAPPIDVILVKAKDEGPFAYGAKGVGELATIPTAPAAAAAYYRFDGTFRTKLPMDGTVYRKGGKS